MADGMTVKKYWLVRFYELCSLYKEAKQNIGTEEGNKAFILLSIQLHIAKGRVPKRLWPLVNK